MKYQSVLLIFFFITSIGQTQSIADFDHKKLKGNVTESVSQSYNNVQLNEHGDPILDVAPGSSTITTIKDGYPLLSKSYQSFMSRDEPSMEFEYTYDDDLLKKVKIYSIFQKERNLFKWYQIFHDDRKVRSENVYYDKDDLRASFHYTHTTTGAGHPAVDVKMYKPTESEASGFYSFEYNDKNEVIYKTVSTKQDTGLIYRFLSNEGDSIYTAQITHTARGYKNRKFTSQLSIETKTDKYGNPISSLTTITGFNPETDQEEVFHSFSLMTYKYTEDGPPENLNLNELSGEYINKTDNLRLIINEDLSFELKDLEETEDEISEEKVVSENDWIDLLRNKHNYTYDNKSGIIHFSDVLKEGVKVNKNPYAMVFSPIDPKLKEMYFTKTK